MQWGAFAIEVATDGAGFRLLHGAEEWAAFTLDGLRPIGRFTDDPDEVEHGFALPGVSCSVRHSIDQAWTMRWALSASEPVVVERAGVPVLQISGSADAAANTDVNDVRCSFAPRLRVRPGPQAVVWAWAAGAEGVLCVGPRRRSAPVVGLRLIAGWLQRAGDGFALTPERLALTPPRRWVASLRAELYPGMTAVAATLPAWLAPLELTAGQPWEFTQPDQALVVQPPATTRPDGDSVQVIGAAGRTGVTVHSPRGLTALTLSFAPGLDTLLAAGASTVLRENSSRPSAAARFVVAEALGRSLISQPHAATAWLDQHDAQRDPDLLAIATGIVRGQRAGQARPVRAALKRLQTVHPQLGFGRVVMAGWLASLTLGDDAGTDAVALLTRPSSSDWVALELNVLNLRSVEVAGPLFGGLINALGGDLPGEPVGLDVVQQAQLTGLLQLCPEEWPMAREAAACAAKNSRRLLAAVAASDFSDPDDLAVLAWLALGESLV